MPTAVDPRQLGPYEIVSIVGSGAMGHVYRAHDTRLRRDVALKIVDSGFEEEARAVSALNHPNILTIHDVGTENGTAFIVTELIEGRSLRQELDRGALPFRKLLDYAIQLAEGLAAAHQEGIVHRDLKPENIMITRDNRVKIVDFGVAKILDLASDTARTLGRDNAETGLLLGTIAYMSPEQARGVRVSHYTDQFSLGLILYEMATGEAAFKRETALQTLSAILSEDPPALTVASTPFQWLVKRCLHKEPDHRYASTTDLARELQNIRSNLTEQPAPVPDHLPTSRKRRWPWVTLILLVLASALGFIAGKYSLARPAFSSPAFLPLAATDALEHAPAWSPNGRTVAYTAAVDGVFQIFVLTVGGASSSQLTGLPDDCRAPFWSPDGVRIYFVQGGDLWSVGATGGTPEKLAENAVQAAVAPNGQDFAVLRRDPETQFYTLWAGSLSHWKPLDKRRFLPQSYLRYSPDAKHLGAWLSLADGRAEFVLYPVAGGAPSTKLTGATAREFSWMPDSKRIVYSERSGISVRSHLWLAHLASGHIEQVTNGTTSEFAPAVSPDGRSIAFTSGTVQ